MWEPAVLRLLRVTQELRSLRPRRRRTCKCFAKEVPAVRQCRREVRFHHNLLLPILTFCPLLRRHEREVKEAEAAARAAAMSENPDVSEKDLEIKLSDAVQKATKDRIQRAAAVPGGVPAPPGFGGLFARMPRLGRYLDLDEADDDEDFDEDLDLDDEDLFEARRPQRRRDVGNGMARLARLIEQEQGRQAAPAVPAAEPHRAANPRLHLADPRLRRRPANLQGPNVPVNPAPVNPPLPRMQGFIPVFGYRPQMPRAIPAAYPAGNPPAAQPLEQAPAPAAYHPPRGDLLEELEGHLFGDFFGNQQPGELAAVQRPVRPAPPPQAPPQVGVGQGGNTPGEARHMHDRLHRAQQIRLQHQQRLLRQQAQALQQQHLRNHGQDYHRLREELARAQRAQIAAMFQQQRQAEQQQQAGADLAQQHDWTRNGGHAH